jgi:hypothetical protein
MRSKDRATAIRLEGAHAEMANVSEENWKIVTSQAISGVVRHIERVNSPHCSQVERLQMSTCPICVSRDASVSSLGPRDVQRVDCPRCGLFDLTETVYSLRISGLTSLGPAEDPIERDTLSYGVRRLTMHSGERTPLINSDVLTSLQRNAHLNNPPDQLDELVLWAGTHTDDPGAVLVIRSDALASVVGARSSGLSIRFLLDSAASNGLITTDYKPTGQQTVRLTLAGWERFAALQRRQPDTLRAFMAMQFNSQDTDRAYRECFKPASKAAGFDLFRLDEGQGAGLIDDQLRVAIRTARFLLADLSDRNRGAYWEAGFAEGLDKPVIYLCNQELWDDPKQRPHFDTSHLVTVIWSLADLADAQRKLTATIRATFPSDAIMDDI